MRAKDAIPYAWDKLTEGDADSRLAKMLIDEASSISGYAPQDEDVMAFILSLRDRSATSFIRPSQTPFTRKSPASRDRRTSPEKQERKTRRNLNKESSSQSTTPSKSKKTISFVLKGKPYEAKSQIDAYAQIIELMGRENLDFLDSLASELSHSKTKALARSKDELASQEILDKQNVAVPIMNGSWWLYTKINRNVKINNLKTACRIAGIPFGTPDGLMVDF